MQRVSFVEFRKHLSEYVGKARFAGKRIGVTHHGKLVGGFVSPEALELLDELETKKELQAFDRGLESIKKHGTMTFDEFKEEIGL